MQIGGAKATHLNRLVRTTGFLAEQAVGKSLWPGIIELRRAVRPGSMHRTLSHGPDHFENRRTGLLLDADCGRARHLPAHAGGRTHRRDDLFQLRRTGALFRQSKPIGLKQCDWQTSKTQDREAPVGCFVSEAPFATHP